MFEVQWLPTALDGLARIWLQASSAERQEITAASRLLDNALQDHPEKQGESRDINERVVFAHPLGVRIAIDYERSTVRVLKAWHIRRRH
ncbi:MAG: hypothetical protein WD894_22935 [Pirellulales bacterium]